MYREFDISNHNNVDNQKGASMKFKDEMKRLEGKWDSGYYKKPNLSESEELEATFYSAYYVLFEDFDGHKRMGVDQETSLKALYAMGHAAENGNALAQYVLGYISITESKEFDSQKRGAEYMLRAASQGLEEAKDIVGE
jgi:TPR repeat protein